jgi:predicted ATPase
MKRCILTGTPGSGKTSILRAIEIRGYRVIEEAATDVISHEQMLGDETPWLGHEFVDRVVTLQKQRQMYASFSGVGAQFYDRSPICTYALAKYLNVSLSKVLLAELDRMQAEAVYDQAVFFIENLGTIQNTEARQISFEESLVFEKIHKDAYASFGYTLISIPKAPLPQRVDYLLTYM